MRETVFIRQNQKKWADYEAYLNQAAPDPERLREMFTSIMDDLAYARTFYPNRSVHYYLNGLAQRILPLLHRRPPRSWHRLLTFWTDTMPRLLWETRRALWLSFGVFCLSFCVGVLSSRTDPDFARYILGDRYVDMTLSNIQAGDPMAVYKELLPTEMSASIAANNLMVSLITVLSGVLTPIGTLFVLIKNGVMVGTFQYFFYERDLFWPSFLTIWTHGTLEISAIIASGAAGLVIGSGLLFPGTYTRRQAFQQSARKGVYLFLGLIPIFLLAAFFEGFLTRHTDLPAAWRLGLILLSLAASLGYLVWLPWRKARRNSRTQAVFPELLPTAPSSISFVAIKSSGAILLDVFSILFRQPRPLLSGASIAAALLTGVYYLTQIHGRSEEERVRFLSERVSDRLEWLSSLSSAWLFGPMACIPAALFAVGLAVLRREMPLDFPARKEGGWSLRFAFALLLFGEGLVWLSSKYPVAMLGWLCLLAGFWLAEGYFDGKTPKYLPNWTILKELRTFSVLYLSLLFLGGLFSLLAHSVIGDLVLSFFGWLFPIEGGWQMAYYHLARVFIDNFAISFVSILLFLGGALLYFSHREKQYALHLREQVERVGTSARIRGLPRE
jgi:uncharacterized membrane protein SpoIIM required for sporulation